MNLADPARAAGVTTGSGLQAAWLEASVLDADDRAAWSALADRALEPNPFLRPEFVLPNMIHRGVSARLMVVRDGSTWVACLPVGLRRPTRRLPLPHLEALTDEYALCGTPLIDRALVEPAADALVEMMADERRAAVFVLGKFGSDGPVSAAVSASAARRGVRPIVVRDYERAAWRRSAHPDVPGARLKRSDLKELRRRSRLIALELGSDPEVVDRSDEPAGWEAFLAMENSGWKEERGTALASTEADAAFFRQMCAGMSARGILEIVALTAGDHTIAMECHLIDGDVLYSFKIAHASAFRRFSPGTQLKYRVIESLHERGVVLGDSCAVAGNSHMNRLWPDRRRIQTILVPTGATSARLVRPGIWALGAADRVRDTIVRRSAGAAVSPDTARLRRVPKPPARRRG